MLAASIALVVMGAFALYHYHAHKTLSRQITRLLQIEEQLPASSRRIRSLDDRMAHLQARSVRRALRKAVGLPPSRPPRTVRSRGFGPEYNMPPDVGIEKKRVPATPDRPASEILIVYPSSGNAPTDPAPL
jgi:hypothetical protein